MDSKPNMQRSNRSERRVLEDLCESWIRFFLFVFCCVIDHGPANEIHNEWEPIYPISTPKISETGCHTIFLYVCFKEAVLTKCLAHHECIAFRLCD